MPVLSESVMLSAPTPATIPVVGAVAPLYWIGV